MSFDLDDPIEVPPDYHDPIFQTNEIEHGMVFGFSVCRPDQTYEQITKHLFEMFVDIAPIERLIVSQRFGSTEKRRALLIFSRKEDISMAKLRVPNARLTCLNKD